jgi:hypothetical protein
MILQYPHLKHKMLASLFGWFVQYPNVGHKICMFNEKMMMIKINKNRRDKLIMINSRRNNLEHEKKKKGEKVKEDFFLIRKKDINFF